MVNGRRMMTLAVVTAKPLSHATSFGGGRHSNGCGMPQLHHLSDVRASSASGCNCCDFADHVGENMILGTEFGAVSTPNGQRLHNLGAVRASIAGAAADETNKSYTRTFASRTKPSCQDRETNRNRRSQHGHGQACARCARVNTFWLF